MNQSNMVKDAENTRICTCCTCGGLGCIPSKDYILCPDCEGKGYIYKDIDEE